MHQLGVGPPPEPRQAHAEEVIDVEIPAHPTRVALALVQKPGEVDAHVVTEPFADHQHVARGAGPAGVVEWRPGAATPGYGRRHRAGS